MTLVQVTNVMTYLCKISNVQHNHMYMYDSVTRSKHNDIYICDISDM